MYISCLIPRIFPPLSLAFLSSSPIQAFPGKIADAVEKKIDETVDAVERKIDETVEEIKAAPGQIAEYVEGAIEDAVDDVVEAVEGVVSMPGKKLEEMGLIDVSAAAKKPASASIPLPPPLLLPSSKNRRSSRPPIRSSRCRRSPFPTSTGRRLQ